MGGIDLSNHIYIASPYSHRNKEIVEERYQAVMKYEIHLIKKHFITYSPIVHCHNMAKIGGLPTDAAYWMSRNFAMIKSARELHVLQLPGWNGSIGVNAEISFWRTLSGYDPFFIDPENYSPVPSLISPKEETK